jgi:pimeloyl-ACP methyl ester carboxylesterase
MPQPAIKTLSIVAAALLGAAVVAGCAALRPQEPRTEIGFLDIGSGIQLRRLVARPARPEGSVLFLHGFPETLHAWDEIYPALARDYEVHAFDWPGYGQSSRPPADSFPYAPRDYARVLQAYIRRSDIDTRTLTIYATDIGALPALLLALDEPGIARAIIVGDFAPFDRPQYMVDYLQALKTGPAADAVRANLNRNRDEILENAYRRGLAKEEQFDISPQYKADMLQGWNQGRLSTADAFSHYYAHFTRDQAYLEANLAKLKTPVKVVWGEKDFYIRKDMGVEFAQKAGLPFSLLPGLGHYPHLQDPRQTVEEVRASFTSR